MNTAQIGPRASILSLDSVGYRHSGTYTYTPPETQPEWPHSAELRVNRRTCLDLRGALKGWIGQRDMIILNRYVTSVIPEPPRIVPFSFGRDVFDEGEYAQISCIVSSGDLPIKISWSLQGSDNEISGGGRGITTASMGARASFLSIDSVGSQHGGEYTCTARNKAGVSSLSTSLRVNGNCKKEDRNG